MFFAGPWDGIVLEFHVLNLVSVLFFRDPLIKRGSVNFFTETYSSAQRFFDRFQ